MRVPRKKNSAQNPNNTSPPAEKVSGSVASPAQAMGHVAALAMILVAINKLSAKRQAFFVQLLHPELNDGQIAQLCGTSQTTLSRSETYRQVRRRSRASANARAEGTPASRRLTRNTARPQAPRQATALHMVETGLRHLGPVKLAVWLGAFRPELSKSRIAELCGIGPSQLTKADEFRRLRAAERQPSMRRGWVDRDGNIEGYDSHPE